MSDFVWKSLHILFLAFLCALASQACENPSYEFEMLHSNASDKPFLFEINGDDTLAMQSLQPYLDENGDVMTNENGDPSINVVQGTLIEAPPGATSSKHAWSFSFRRDTIEFSDVGLISCDATFMIIEDNLDYWLEERGGKFCPWNSKHLIRKITKRCQKSQQSFPSR